LGLLKLLLGFVEPAFPLQDLRKASMGFGASGIDAQRSPQMVRRLGELALFGERQTPLILCLL